jgi:phenylalanyl-tRNA synthetase beta chain
LYPFRGPEILIRAAKIRGEASQGMLCAENEIGISDEHDGLMVLSSDCTPGTPFVDYYGEHSDTVYTLGITPNRMDALSHYGVARDLGAALNIPLIPLQCLCREESVLDPNGIPLPVVKSAGLSSSAPDAEAHSSASTAYSLMSLRVESGEDCPRLAGLAIEGVVVGPSPDWLQEALRSIGHKPINNIVDVTNFVQFELGQPLHAYDRSYLEGNLLGVRLAKAGEKLTLLDHREYLLSRANLVIEDGQKAVGLAGIMGGAGDSIHAHTRSVYLECACFDPIRIRQSARALGLRSEASYRFERGTDPNLVPLALERAASLMIACAGGFVPYPLQYLESGIMETETLTFRQSALERIAGCSIPSWEIQRILSALDFDLRQKSETSNLEGEMCWEIRPPYYRRDVRRSADVAEEIMRIWGYNKIPIPSAHRYRNDFPLESNLPVWQERISDWLSARGFSEFIGLSFVSQDEFQAIEPNLNRAVRVLGPVNEQIPLLRPSLLLSGLRHIAHNLNRRQNSILCYEFGRTYLLREGSSDFLEEESLCLMVTGLQNPESWYRSEQAVDLPYLKGHVMDLLQFCNAGAGSEPPLHLQVADALSRAAAGKLPDLAAVDPALLRLFDIKQPVFYAILPWTEWIPLPWTAVPACREIPKFPSMRRDLALVVPVATPFRHLEQVARDQGGPFLESLQLFDVYSGKGLPEGHVSYAIGLTFRHPEQTLTDAQVEETIQAMLITFEKSLGARLRR